MPSYSPSAYPSTNSPPHNRLRHSPTKSSPLRHALSTRSNGSEPDTSISTAQVGAVNGLSTLSFAQSSSDLSDPFITSRTSVKRDRSESPVKKSAAFAKWEEREQAEQEHNGSPRSLRRVETTRTNPKKLRDDDWRGHSGLGETRPALQPVAINARADTKVSTPTKSESPSFKENAVSPSPQHTVEFVSEEMSPRPFSHSRAQSMETKISPATSPINLNIPTLSNKNSFGTLSRSDSMRASTKPRERGHIRFNSTDHALPQLDDDDIVKLQKSSTPQLRHLSKLASESGTGELSVHSPEEQVVGLAGRRRLQRVDSTRGPSKQQSQFASQFASTKWMETQRKHLQAYEYLCHIGEARAWIQDVLEPAELPPIVQLEEALRDGVTLAETVVRLAPVLPTDQQRVLGSFRIFRSEKLQYRHSDNIALFFRFLALVELPELFRFELIDLYEKKNVPKVIYCIHALSWLLYRKGIVNFRIGNLLGQLQFADHELEETQRGIDRSGIQMPNFGGMREAMQIEVEPPPEPSPQELLQQHEGFILDFQSQIRGAMLRTRLGDLMQDLWDVEPSIAFLQALVRGGFAREIFDFKRAMDHSTRALQAHAKGFLVRARQQRQERLWSNNTRAVTMVQSLWRGRQQRAQTRLIQSQLQRHRHGIKDFQAVIRGALGRWRAGDIWHEAQQAGSEVEAVQAAIRGALERNRISRLLNAVDEKQRQIVGLQALLRGNRARRDARMTRSMLATQDTAIYQLQALAKGLIRRRQIRRDHGKVEQHTVSLVDIQSIAKGHIVRSQQAQTMAELRKHSTGVVDLQACVRAFLQRSQFHTLRQDLSERSRQAVNVQSAIRGWQHRRQIGLQLEALEDQEPMICNLQSIARGHLERERVYELLLKMDQHLPSIAQLQAHARGVLARDCIDDDLSNLEAYEDTIVDLQAASRAAIVRGKFAAKQKHYRDNMAKVVKLQSFVRAKQQGESYQALVNGNNPPLPVVRRHLHLLTDSQLEFESEIEAERLRREVTEKLRQNEEAEKYVETLEVKIALLVKNKITLDEVVKHQKHYGGSASQLLKNGSTMNAPGAGLDLKALNKSSRKKLTCYEELFFLLQTQPQYLSGLFRQLTAQGLPEKDAKLVEKHIMTLFGNGVKSREEYFLLKLFADSLQQTAALSQSPDDFMRQYNAAFTQRLVLCYMRSSKDRSYLKALLGSLIRDGICAQDDLDLESDPLQIYRAILNHEELSTGRASHRPREIPREVAIRENDVRPTYVQHLQDLRDLCDSFFVALDESIPRIPYGVRYVLAEQYRALICRFPQDDRSHILMLVGNWLWRSYLLPTLREPELWGVIDRGLSPSHKRNLGQVVTTLGQVTMGRAFGAENMYLQPLNSWIMESLERWHGALYQILEIPSPEEHYNADEYSDLYARTKPILYVKPSDIFTMHSLVSENLPAIAPAKNDLIRELLADLGTAKSNEVDLSGAARGGEITLTLKPRHTMQEDPNAEARTLFTATKRLVLYIIKVQSGSNLMEILTRPITHEDADRWIEVLEEEHAEKSKEQRRSKRPMSALDSRASMRGGRTQSVYSEIASVISENPRDLMDIENLTYAELKSTALENILLLERRSTPVQFRVSRESNYQELLNALAADIRQKHRRRMERLRENESTHATLRQLGSKARYLTEQQDSYDEYIAQCLRTLASKKGSRNKFTMPFTKQWLHKRELEKSGRQPEFGSYKYSARQLADKGVLLSWDGYSHEHWGQLDVVISSDQAGLFHMEASSGSMLLPGGSANLLLEDLLNAQYDNQSAIAVFEEGTHAGARLAVNLLLHLVFKKFYRDE